MKPDAASRIHVYSGIMALSPYLGCYTLKIRRQQHQSYGCLYFPLYFLCLITHASETSTYHHRLLTILLTANILPRIPVRSLLWVLIGLSLTNPYCYRAVRYPYSALAEASPELPGCVDDVSCLHLVLGLQ
jgi:hypothetical protein